MKGVNPLSPGNNGIMDSMGSDSVPAMLASLSEDIAVNKEQDGVIDMINWDKVPSRGNRGMSAITTKKSSKIAINDSSGF